MARLGIDRDFLRELGKLERLRPERSGGTVNSTPRTFRPAGDVGSPVEAHLSRIFTKLGVRSRAAVGSRLAEERHDS